MPDEASENEKQSDLSNFSIIESDGTERRLTHDESASFFQSIKALADQLEERDGNGAWKAAVEELNQTVPGLKLKQLGGYVPIQGYGTYEGEECYFRARYSHASFSVGTYDRDPAPWVVKFVCAAAPRFARVDKWDDIVMRRDLVPWLKKIVVRVPGLRKSAPVSSWMPKRFAEAQVTDDEFAAGYLTPAECVVIIRDLLIPNLHKCSKKEGKAKVKAFTTQVRALAKEFQKSKEGNASK